MITAQNERTLVFDLLEVRLHRKRSGTAVFVFLGDLDMSNATPVYETLLSEWVYGANDIIYDLSKIDFIDSSGMRSLVRLQREAIKRGVTLRISIGMNHRLQRLFKMCGLDRVFTLLSAVTT
jgi:anti-sigma B factor antagonist